jgi:CBS domain containing-hemolysin-like protein
METIAMAALALLAGFGGGQVELFPSVAIVVGLLCCSAFFSGSESALFSLDSITLEKLDQSPSRTGKAVQKLLSHPRKLLATLLLGNEIVNIGLSSVMAAIVFTVASDLGSGAGDIWWLNIVFATPLLLIFGEVVPKAVAVRTGIRWAQAVSLPLQAFAALFAPLRIVLEGAAQLVLVGINAASRGRLTKLKTDDDTIEAALEEAQFRALVRQGAREGSLDPREAALIHRVFDLTDMPVSKLMTSRAEVKALSLNSSGDELAVAARTSGYSRLPVYAGDLDHIRGILLLKDLLRFRANDEEVSARGLERMLQEPYFVPPGKPAGQLLREFQSKRAHIAIVLDEYGTFLGIVTMQDVLETLFEPMRRSEGETASESGPNFERLADGVFRVPARMSIEDFNRRIGPPLPTGDTYTTVAGYIFHLFGKLPAKGDQISDRHWSFHVSGLEGTRLTQVSATRRERSQGARSRARDLGLPVTQTQAVIPTDTQEDEE